MVIDQRQLIIDSLMKDLPDSLRYDKNADIPFVSKREHIQWIRRNPAPGENRSLIEDTGFKPPTWSTKPIKLKRPKRRK